MACATCRWTAARVAAAARRPSSTGRAIGSTADARRCVESREARSPNSAAVAGRSAGSRAIARSIDRGHRQPAVHCLPQIRDRAATRSAGTARPACSPLLALRRRRGRSARRTASRPANTRPTPAVGDAPSSTSGAVKAGEPGDHPRRRLEGLRRSWRCRSRSVGARRSRSAGCWPASRRGAVCRRGARRRERPASFTPMLSVSAPVQTVRAGGSRSSSEILGVVGHHDERPAAIAVAPIAQDRHDVRVTGQPAHRPLLAQEPGEIVRVEVGRPQDLHGDRCGPASAPRSGMPLKPPCPISPRRPQIRPDAIPQGCRDVRDGDPVRVASGSASAIDGHYPRPEAV